jgi:hypothetical protein
MTVPESAKARDGEMSGMLVGPVVPGGVQFNKQHSRAMLAIVVVLSDCAISQQSSLPVMAQCRSAE